MQSIGNGARWLAAAALIATPIVAPAAALAKDPVEAQANKVAAKAQDLQVATNKLDAEVANAQANDAGAGTAATDRDRDRDNRRGDRDGDDDANGKWGLLGLLGLAGLLGLRRRDNDHQGHVHGNRRDDLDRSARTAPRTGTGMGTDTSDTRL